MTRIQLETGFLTLPKDANFPISLSIKDITGNGSRGSGYSKALNIDGTENNTVLLGAYFDIDLSNNTFDRNKKTTCSVIQEGVEVFTGFIQLMEIERINKVRSTNTKVVEYKIVVFDEVANFYNEMGDKDIKLLSFPELSHTFNRANIISSWSNTEGYTYPQYAKEDNIYTLRDFKPAIFEWEYFKKIFASNGYTFTFDQFDDTTIQMDKRIIPYNGKNGDDSVNEFLKQAYTVRGTMASDSYLLDETALPTYPVGWLPMLDYLTGTAVNDYTTASGSKMSLDTILEDTQVQYYTGTDEITNKGGQGRTFQILTSYDYRVDVRALDSGSSPVAWEVDNFTGGSSRCEVKLTLVAQSTTDNNKIAYIDAGTTMIDFVNGGTYTYPSGWNTLGTGTNASFADLGVFDANEKFDVHTIVTARYFIPDGVTVIANSPPYQTLNSLDTNNAFVNASCEFVDQATGDPIRLEFDIDITNLTFKAVPDVTELVQGSSVDINAFIPKGVKQRDLISTINKTYNLFMVPDPNNETNIIIKTRDQYYNDGAEWDWTDKFQEAQKNTISFISNDAGQEQKFKYKEDKDLMNTIYQDEFDETYGQTTIVLDNEYTVGDNTKELIYSPTPSIKAAIGVPLPSINGIDPDTNIRVLLHNGSSSVYNYPFYDDVLPNPSELAFIDEYCNTSMFDDDFAPDFSICFDAPDALFHGFQTGQTSNYLYNLHYQRETTTINQGSKLVGYFNLDEGDFQKLSKQLDWKIFIKDNGWFVISKVHNYNSNKNTLTKVDLLTADEKSQLLFRTPPPPVKTNGVIFDTVITKHFSNIAQSSNIIIGTGQVNIQGKYNFVNGSQVFIQGNQNNVSSSNVKIMGDRNTIPVGYGDTTIISNDKTSNQSGIIIGVQGESLNVTDDITIEPYQYEIYYLLNPGIIATLPDADPYTDAKIYIKNKSGGNCTLTASVGSIDEQRSVTLTKNESLTLHAKGGVWNIL